MCLISNALDISVFADQLVGGSVFVGAQNYVRAFTDGAFWRGVRHMFLFMIVQVPIMLGLALLFALLLDGGSARLKTLFRLGYFLPYAIPGVVSVLLWGYLYGPSFGPFAQFAGTFHLPPPSFLTETGMLPSIGNIVTWQYTGYNMIMASGSRPTSNSSTISATSSRTTTAFSYPGSGIPSTTRSVARLALR